MKTIAVGGLAALCAMTFALAGCDEKSGPSSAPVEKSVAHPAAPTTALAAPEVPPAPAQHGSIVGTVEFTGTPPKAAPIDMATEPVCAKGKAVDESVVVNANKTLRNVIVRVSSPLPFALPPPPTSKVVVEQKGCMYEPRVQAAVSGQTIELRNDDPAMHNTHSYLATTTVWNVAQPAGTPPVDRVVKGNLTLIKMKCDVHPWMTGWISVTNHPWFAVTGESGRFEIKDVPVGTYKLEAWHEKFGSKTVDVTVTADKPAEVKFAYDGTEH